MSNYQMHGDVAVISMNNPPMNTMSHGNRGFVKAAVDAANLDAAVKAIVLTGGGKVFSSGAEIKEFNTPAAVADPNLRDVIKTLEDSPKPIVAAVHGVAMGGGLELAMGCHYRVASPGALIALPEVKLGVLPGAGGTQRLPRLIGVEKALDMIVTGNPVKSEKFTPGTLFEQVVAGDLIAAAVTLAGEMAAKGGPYKRVRDINIKAPSATFFADARAATAKAQRGYPAPVKCVDAVEASTTMAFDAGCNYERECFMELVATNESKAMRHYFFGERTVAKIPDVPDDTPLRPINSAAVIGAGTMGGGITMNFINAGIPVTMLEMKQEALDKGLGIIRKNYENTAKKGRMTMEEVEQRMALITPTLSYDALKNADIVVEAVFEDMAVKETVFKQLDAVMKPGAILASNTSTLDVNKIASFTKRPESVIGTHFFSPANVMKLLEVVRGAATAKDVLATTMKLAKRIKKIGVVSGVCDGFIGNRMIEQYSRQAGFLLEEGASPEQVDKTIEKIGFAMGPFRMGDLAGNDVGWYIRKRRYVEKPNVRYSKTADLICEQGRFGQKTSAGWYDYKAGDRTPYPSSVVQEILEKHRKAMGVTPRLISDDEIVERLMYALVNEGALIIEEGIAMRAVDIDMIYMSGYGVPPFLGGPMFFADRKGLKNVVASMEKFASNKNADPGFWKPAPLLAKLAAADQTFN